MGGRGASSGGGGAGKGEKFSPNKRTAFNFPDLMKSLTGSKGTSSQGQSSPSNEPQTPRRT